MELDPKKVAQYQTSDKTSFAYTSLIERWPVILTGAVDNVYRASTKIEDPERQAEGRRIVEQLSALKYELLHNRKLTPLEDDGFEDVAAYNRELQQLGSTATWSNVPWLFSECYMYRRISTFFKKTTHWKDYDIFARQKNDTFRSSRTAVLELAAKYRELMGQLRDDSATTKDPEAEELLFTEMCEICLWGNATDLSLLTTITYEDIQKRQGAAARKAAEENILINDISGAYRILKKAQQEGKKERRVDIVLDNAGFELYVDLVLAGYLLSSGLATQIIIHPKVIPWFVSDVLPTDFALLLNAVANPRLFFETQSEDEAVQGKVPEPLADGEEESLKYLFQEWATLHAGGQLIMRPNRYWTAAGSFWRLPTEASELFEDLKESELVIFKGDLNYRKLTADADWDPTTSFTEAIGPMGAGSGVNVLSLRTCKADVVVGLQPGEDEKLRAAEGGGGDTGARKWAWSGKWAVMSLSEGKSQ